MRLHDRRLGDQHPHAGTPRRTASSTSKVDSGRGVIEVCGLVAHGSENLGAERLVVGGPSQVEGVDQVPLRRGVFAGVVRHPSGELCRLGGGAQERATSPIVEAAVPQHGRDLVMQVADDRRVSAAATVLVVHLAERAIAQDITTFHVTSPIPPDPR